MAKKDTETAPAVDETKDTETALAVDDGLVAMSFPGSDDIRVHPDQIDGWKAHGWTVVQ